MHGFQSNGRDTRTLGIILHIFENQAYAESLPVVQGRECNVAEADIYSNDICTPRVDLAYTPSSGVSEQDVAMPILASMLQQYL